MQGLVGLKKYGSKFVFSLLRLTLLVPTSVAQDYAQLGPDIEGSTIGIQSGWSVSLSADGEVLAIGAPENDSSERDTGSVSVYVLNDGNWVQRGQELNGIVPRGHFGFSTALSATGDVLAVGSYSSHITRVFGWDGSAWHQRGLDIEGAIGEQFGFAIDISNSGDQLIIASPSNGEVGRRAGRVQVFEWDGTAWGQKGQVIYGSVIEDLLGTAVSISGDGDALIVGATGDHGPLTTGLGTRNGYARVFDWNGSEWAQRGNDLEGEGPGDRFGASVDISDDGKVIAVGAPENDDVDGNAGHVRVFDWEGDTWLQRGLDIDGEGSADYFGRSIALSSTGNVVAVGSPMNDYQFSQAGSVSVLAWTGDHWEQRGEHLRGRTGYERLGWSVSISDNGSRLAVGAVYAADRAGQSRVFDYSSITDIHADHPDALSINSPLISQVFPNPFQESIAVGLQIETTSFVRLSVVDILGREIYIIHDGLLNPGEHFFRWSGDYGRGNSVSAGVYFIVMRGENGVSTKAVSLIP